MSLSAQTTIILQRHSNPSGLFTLDGKGAGNWKEVLGPTGAKPFSSRD